MKRHINVFIFCILVILASPNSALPWVVGSSGGAGTTEVQDEVWNAGNFNGDTTHAVSQDDAWDREAAYDTDHDGDVDTLDSGAVVAGYPGAYQVNNAGALAGAVWHETGTSTWCVNSAGAVVLEIPKSGATYWVLHNVGTSGTTLASASASGVSFAANFSVAKALIDQIEQRGSGNSIFTVQHPTNGTTYARVDSNGLFASALEIPPSATPSWTGRDSDFGGGTDAWKVYGNLDDVNNGDMYLQARQDGALHAFMQFDESDDQVEIKDDMDLEGNALENARIVEVDPLPAAWSKEINSDFDTYVAAPDATGVTDYTVAFDSGNTECRTFFWPVPDDFAEPTANTVKVRPRYTITSATEPGAGEGVAWEIVALGSYGTGDKLGYNNTSAASGSGNTVYIVTADLDAHSQADLVQEAFTAIVVPDLTAGEMAAFLVCRAPSYNDGAGTEDDYLQDVGLDWLDVKYYRDLGSATW